VRASTLNVRQSGGLKQANLELLALPGNHPDRELIVYHFFLLIRRNLSLLTMSILPLAILTGACRFLRLPTHPLLHGEPVKVYGDPLCLLLCWGVAAGSCLFEPSIC